MNTEYAVGNIRIRLASQARRRWFVALVYAALAVFILGALFLSQKNATGAWLTASCGILYIALWIAFSGLAGDPRARGDEREVHRRDHAHFRAYYALGFFLFGALIAGSFRGPDPITPHLPLALRGYFMQLPFVLLLTTALLYGTLPSAILLWTEPDIEEAE
ncbi:MAG: hypothetical protein KGJ51_11110 [Acidobacteriota bacterium]|nr:hypothetical protein [Acidobacteriota bacterium]